MAFEENAEDYIVIYQCAAEDPGHIGDHIIYGECTTGNEDLDIFNQPAENQSPCQEKNDFSNRNKKLLVKSPEYVKKSKDEVKNKMLQPVPVKF
jgi:hypothetical protein